MRGVTESLAGRVAIIDLLGFSQAELDERQGECEPFLPTKEWVENARKTVPNPRRLKDVYHQIWLGSFPRVNVDGQELTRELFYSSYVQTYLQRDVKDILHVSKDTDFYNFLTAVAARTGQVLNFADLARDVGIDNKTAKSWLSVLETSGLVYLLQPYHRNVTKRVIKSPKIYFLDTGLCAYLTKWPNAESLEAGAMSGALLETYVFAEILKSYWHHGREAPIYHYRDTDQKEVDFLIERGDTIYPIEVKKTGTPSQTAAKHFPVLKKLGKTVGYL
jgi:predicted AAA+ superfamily ATPase